MLTEEPETIYRIVNNRILILGIDEIYRKYMKEFESVFLLPQVEVIAAKLNVHEADVPIEGYYGEHETLTRYFKLIRALQEVAESSEILVHDLPEFHKIWEVTNSPIFGKPIRKGKLLPQGRDPLSQALEDTKDMGWKAQKIIGRAYEVVMGMDDISLVGLTVRLKDPIVITALRESVILYAEKLELGYYQEPKIKYLWKVDNEFAQVANRLIEEFNKLLPKDSYISNGIPKAEPQNANRFYSSFGDNEILGRCANLGLDRSSPPQHYHWAITKQKDEFALDEFWDTKLWTTDEYRAKQKQLGWKFLKDGLAK
jgi:hypothetical protein